MILLNPNYRIRNDLDRQVLCTNNPPVSAFDYSPKWKSVIHPYYSAIFSAFCEGSQFAEGIALIANHFHLEIGIVKKLIEPFVENENIFFTEFMGHRIFFPKKVLVRANDFTWKYSRPQIDRFDGKTINLSSDRCHKAPDSLLFIMTTKCVTSCAYCYCDRKTKYKPLSKNRLLEIIDEAYKLGVSYVDVVGGEVFCYSGWENIIRSLVERGMSPTYLSTKVPIDEQIILKLKYSRYEGVIQLSVDSLSQDIMEKVISARDNYVAKIINGIKLLVENGYKVQVNTMLNNLNCNKTELDKLYAFVRTIKTLQCWEIRVANTTLYQDVRWANLRPTREKLQSTFDYIRYTYLPEFKEKLLINDTALQIPHCSANMYDKELKGGTCGMLKDRLTILPDGKVTICEEMYWHPNYIIGDLSKSSISEIWNSDKVDRLLHPRPFDFRTLSHCHKCERFTECHKNNGRCIVRILRAYGEENYNMPDPRCVYAPPFDENIYV